MPSTGSGIIYTADESSYVNHKFSSVAGLAFLERDQHMILQDLENLKLQYNYSSPIKWDNYRPNRRDNIHKRYVDYFLEKHHQGIIDFHIKFLETEKWDYKLYNDFQYKKITPVHVNYLQLFEHKVAKYYRQKHVVKITTDRGPTTKRLPEKLNKLNSNIRTRYQTKTQCIHSIERKSIRECIPLQLLEMPLGALTMLRNNKLNTPPHKIEIAQYILDGLNILNIQSKKISSSRLDIWNSDPTPKEKFFAPAKYRLSKRG